MDVLVAYATRAGSTLGVAEEIAKTLCDEGDSVTVLDADDVADVTRYDAVVLGSGIRARRWLTEASDLLRQFSGDLARMPVACFAVCLSAVEQGDRSDAEVERYAGYPQHVAPDLTPLSSRVFAGTLDFEALSLSEQFIARAFGVPEGDYRDWDAIRDWAHEVREEMARALVAGGV